MSLSEDQQAIANAFERVFQELEEHLQLLTLAANSLQHAHDRLEALEEITKERRVNPIITL